MQGYQDLKIKSVETITLTPAIAENLLQKNNGNRKLQPATVNRYAKTMRLTVMPMFWNLLKYKKFVSQSEYDILDRNRSELRKIFQKKYAEIFS